MRRVVTGHDEEGKSIVVLDGPPAQSIGEDVGGLFELWNTDGNLENASLNLWTLPPSWSTAITIFLLIEKTSSHKSLICSLEIKFLVKKIMPPTWGLLIKSFSWGRRVVPSILSMTLPYESLDWELLMNLNLLIHPN